jgi:hypothetical protein
MRQFFGVHYRPAAEATAARTLAHSVYSSARLAQLLTTPAAIRTARTGRVGREVFGCSPGSTPRAEQKALALRAILLIGFDLASANQLI